MLRRLCAYFASHLVGSPAICIYQSAFVAICLATCSMQVATLLGTSLPASLAMLAALALGITAGAAPAQAVRRWRLPGATSAAILHFALAAWMVASPWVLQIVDSAISQPGFISLTSSVRNAVALFALALIVLGMPAFLASRLATDPDAVITDRQRRQTFVFLGAAAGLAVWGIELAPIVGPYHCGVLAAGLGLGIALVESYRSPDTDPNAALLDSSRFADSSDSMPEPIVAQGVATGRPFSAPLLIAAAQVFGFGGMLAALGRVLEQLMPGTIYMLCSETIGLCAGIAVGWWLVIRGRGTHSQLERTRLLAVAGAAAWSVGVVATFPLLITGALWLNAYVSSPTLMLLARGALAGLAVLPLAIASILCVAPSIGKQPSLDRLRKGGVMFAGFLGYSAISAWGFQQLSPAWIIIDLAWGVVATTVVWHMVAGHALTAGRVQRLSLGAAVGVIVIAPLWRNNVDSTRSAKLLFNSNAAYAYLTGLNPALLEFLDDGRITATITGDRGIYTVWKYGGHQFQIRENGIPRGVASTDSGAFPRFVPETLQAALPLVLHGKAARVLLLGLGSSESLSATLAFPIPEIVCLETDAGLVRVIREIVAVASGSNPFDEERVTLSICDPALGVSAAPGGFDVIVSSPEHLSLARSQPYLTTEFYSRVARKLSAGGVFCQRLQTVDFGPQVLQAIVRTLQTVFRDVLAVEVAPGEYLLAATNTDAGLIQPGLVARMEQPHVRSVLSQSGVDWTVILDLGAYNHAGLAEFISSSPGTASTASAGQLPFSLPREVIRWAPKVQEVRDAMTPMRQRLLAWAGDDGDSPVLRRRLAEVREQQNLMTKFADQYWAYRATLRSQIKDKPRSQIQQVSATDEDRRLHPEDRRRLRYFQELGRAVRSSRSADIEQLVRFAVPYDPLISYFVHEEAAELYVRSDDRDFVQELRHRLYATYFSSPRDVSLHNIVEALRLIREHPQAEPDLEIRWDDLNALLQALKLRWEARVGVLPANVKETLDEIDKTILAAEQTFEVLEKLTAEAGLPDRLWTNRRRVLEKSLISPVKAFQLELLPHLHRSQAKEEQDRSE